MVSIGLQQLYCAEDLRFCQAGAEHGAQRLLVARLGGGRAAERAERVGEDHARALKERGKLLAGCLGRFQLQQKGGARGGAALSVKAVTGKPIKFIGTGEKLDQIEPFHPGRMASRILGMGDVLTLIEKAEAAFDQKKAAELEQKLRSNKFTLSDFYDQLTQLKGMGGLDEIAGMIPGMNAGALKGAQVDEKAMARTEAIIQSMTPYERENPSVLNHSRKRRIAAGSGVKVEDINRLLKQFDMMNQLAKQFSGPGAQKKMKRMGKKGGFGGFPGFPGM